MSNTSGTTNINLLEAPLSQLTTTLNTQGSVLDTTLTKQSEVISILDRERARLNDRKVAIDAAHVGQKRMIDLTKNATQRNRAVNSMFITAAVALLLYLVIRLSSEMLPELVVNILMVLLVSITVLIIVMLYNDYIRRDNMDYDTINLGEPAQMVGKTSTYGKGGSGSGIIASRIGGGCIEDACCPKGAKYNKNFAICIPNEAPYSAVGSGKDGANFKYFISDKTWKDVTVTCEKGYSALDLSCNSAAPKQPFTTISGSSSSSDKALPNTAYEFSDYNLYK